MKKEESLKAFQRKWSKKTSSNGMHNSCDASCITLATSFYQLSSMSVSSTHCTVSTVVLSTSCERETFFLFRMARNLITFLSGKRQKMFLFFFSLHISQEGTHITFDDSDDDDHESEWNFSFFSFDFMQKKTSIYFMNHVLDLFYETLHFSRDVSESSYIKIWNWF